VFSPAVSAFSERAGDLLLTLSATAATALQNARAYAGEQRARLEAERLQSLTRQLAQSITPDDVLDQIAATAAELLDSPVAGVFLLDAEQQAFELVAGRGLDINQRMRMEVRHSLAGTLIHSGRPEVLADVRGAPVTALPKLVSGEAVGSLVVAPIVSRSGPLGAVEVYSSQPGAFDQRHGELLAALAGAAAAVLENAHLYRQRELDLAHLRTIVEQLPVGVMVVDASGLVSLRNIHAERLFGEAIDLQAAARRSTTEVDARDGTHTSSEPPLVRALRRGEVVTGEHIEIERPDGGRAHLSVNAAPIRDESSAIVAAVAVFDDVSGEEELRRQKEQFLAAAAHDLKTPLTSIRGLVQVLERQLGRLDTQEAQRTQPMLTSIQTATRKMTSLIDELLDVSRLDATGQLTLNRSETDLVEIARAVIAAQRSGAPEHELELVTAAEQLIGWWDGPRLERALSNLVGNAVKYSPDGGTVRVEVSLEREGEAEWVLLSVTDQGIGIPTYDVERIFDRFQRGSNVPQNLAGSGVGLPYVRQVVREHGGSITVRSRPAENTTFTIRLRRGNTDSVEGPRR
jgi:two-component system, OmpR family, phosphate regulon sensor histidine kinase PhoR